MNDILFMNMHDDRIQPKLLWERHSKQQKRRMMNDHLLDMAN